jgi:hypothetical protein
MIFYQIFEILSTVLIRIVLIRIHLTLRKLAAKRAAQAIPDAMRKYIGKVCKPRPVIFL